MDRAKKVLEPLAKEYISKKAEENMTVKLLFFLAREGSDASESIRRFAKLPECEPLLAIVDILQHQVRKSFSFLLILNTEIPIATNELI